MTRAIGVYGNISTAFETPTTTELVNRPDGAGGINPQLEPQRAVSYEMGLKGQLGVSADYQLALYRADVTNELIPFEVPANPGRTFFANAGSALHRGVEFAFGWRPSTGFQLRGEYTHTDARFTEFELGGENFDGNHIPGVAPNRAEILFSFDARAGLYATASGRYVDAVPVNNANNAAAPSYVVADIRLGWNRVPLASTFWSPFVGISNILDKTYVSAVVPNAFGGRYFEPGPGQSLWFGLRWLLGDGD
jgi:iron complex outermembrane receptor protein